MSLPPNREILAKVQGTTGQDCALHGWNMDEYNKTATFLVKMSIDRSTSRYMVMVVGFIWVYTILYLNLCGHFF